MIRAAIKTAGRPLKHFLCCVSSFFSSYKRRSAESKAIEDDTKLIASATSLLSVSNLLPKIIQSITNIIIASSYFQ